MSCALGRLQKPRWLSPSVLEALPTSSVLQWAQPQRNPEQESWPGAFVSALRLNFSFSNGTLGCGKSFIFYSHSKVPQYKLFLAACFGSERVLTRLGLEAYFLWGKQWVYIAAKDVVLLSQVSFIDSSPSLLINMHNCSRHCQLIC